MGNGFSSVHITVEVDMIPDPQWRMLDPAMGKNLPQPMRREFGVVGGVRQIGLMGF